MTAPAVIESQVAELVKQGASQQEAIETVAKTVNALKDQLDKPNYPPVRGEWLPDGGEKVTVRRTANGELRSTKKHLYPSEYKPFSTKYKTFGHFIKDAHRSRCDGEFKSTILDSVSKTIQGMSESVGSDGGVLVLPEFSQQILDRVYDNALFDMTDQYTVSGNNMTFPRNAETSRATGSRAGGIQGYWVGEGGTITSSKPKIEEFTLKLSKIGVVVYLTDELLDDSGFALEQYVTKKVSEEINFLIGDAIINGSGVNQPLGILNSGCLVTQTKESGQSAATITAANIVKMWSRRLASGKYVWLRNQDTSPQMELLNVPVSTAGGQVVYLPPGGFSNSPYATLYGNPVIDTEFSATLGTVGDVILADLSQYITITKGAINQASSMHVEFVSDQMALRFTMRVAGAPWLKSAITPYRGTNTQSSFVCLETR